MKRLLADSDVRWTPLLVSFVVLFASGALPISGQEEPDRFEVRTRALTTVYDNFFRVPDDADVRTVSAWSGDVRVTVRPALEPLVELAGEAEYTRYQDLGETVGGGLALRVGRSPHVFRLRTRYLEDRPAFDLGDVVRTADVFLADAKYRHRVDPSWELGVTGRAIRVQFDSVPGNGSDIYEVGGSLRYRGLGYRLQPEVGGRIGRRLAESDTQDNTGGEVYLRLISIPVDRIWTSVRYRYRSRWYSVLDPESRNFQRTDEGGQWTVASTLRATSHVHLNLYYNYLDMDSTLGRRIFSAQVLTVGVAFLF